MTVLALGAERDPVMGHFLRQCRQGGLDIDFIELDRVAAEGRWRFGIPGGEAVIQCRERRWDLSGYGSIYARIPREPSGRRRVAQPCRWEGMSEALRAWLDTSRTLLVNRPRMVQRLALRSIRERTLVSLGFRVPDSLVSSDGEALRGFLEEHRGNVLRVAEEGSVRAPWPVPDGPSPGGQRPVQLRRVLEGDALRVHVVGEAAVPVGRRFGIAPLGPQLIAATGELGLQAACWDFVIDSDGAPWCLDVDPRPDYRADNAQTGGAVSFALRRLLTRMQVDADAF